MAIVEDMLVPLLAEVVTPKGYGAEVELEL